MSTVIVIQGASSADDVPGIDALPDGCEVRYAPDGDTLAEMLPGAEVVFGWDFRGEQLEASWQYADSLKWVQWTGAGVDSALFDEFIESDVTLTNARGIFDRAMAEFALGLMIAHAKDLPDTFANQRERTWRHELNHKMQGDRVLIVGVGSIGREMARLFNAFGLEVSGVGRTARSGDPDFGEIAAVADLEDRLGWADVVMLIPPLTTETENMFGAAQFAAMKPTALFMNFGRGSLVDEAALIDALAQGRIGGAAIDVTRTEPLPPDDPLWGAPNIIISPHSSGDYKESLEDLTRLFLENLVRYRAGEPLVNMVDKRAGFASS